MQFLVKSAVLQDSYTHKVRLTLTVTLSNITRRWLETSQILDLVRRTEDRKYTFSMILFKLDRSTAWVQILKSHAPLKLAPQMPVQSRAYGIQID